MTIISYNPAVIMKTIIKLLSNNNDNNNNNNNQ